MGGPIAQGAARNHTPRWCGLRDRAGGRRFDPCEASGKRTALTHSGWSVSLTNMASRKSGSPHFNIAEAKTRFSELVQRAMLGEEVIIAKGHKPVLKLVALEPPRRRKPGSAKGRVWMARDFDETPEDFANYV